MHIFNHILLLPEEETDAPSGKKKKMLFRNRKALDRKLISLFFFNYKQSCIMLYSFFWVIPRRLNFIYRYFGTLFLFHLHMWCQQKGQSSCLSAEKTRRTQPMDHHQSKRSTNPSIIQRHNTTSNHTHMSNRRVSN